MKTMIAFMKKEWMEYVRTGKLFMLTAVFVLFGIMNPAIAKLTPFIMEKFATQDSGMAITLSIDGINMSWMQFYKNIPMALIVCILIFSGMITSEIQKGTLILALTKGVSRITVFMTKTINALVLWTAGYWICYGITYFYNEYYWDNSSINNIGFAAIGYWIFGMMLIAVLMLISSFVSSTAIVLLGTGMTYFVISIAGIIPKLKEVLPTKLTDYQSLFDGCSRADYAAPIVISILIMAFSIIAGAMLIRKREV